MTTTAPRSLPTGTGVALGPVLVALGDSFTAGLGDGVTMGHRGASGGAATPGSRLGQRGWAARLAACLGEPGTPAAEFVNLATTGAQVRHLVDEQLAAALAVRPDVAIVAAGLNDVVRPGFDPVRIRRDLEHVVEALRSAGAVVLLVRWHDPTRLLSLPKRLADRGRVRLARLDLQIAEVAGRHGAVVLDFGAEPGCYDLASWDVDRIHPAPAGHALLATAGAQALTAFGYPIRHLPLAAGAGRGTARRWHAHWLLRYGLPWLACRAAAAAPYRRGVRLLRRIGITVLGGGLLVLGGVLIILPGPGFLVIAAGLLVLSLEYQWARKRADWAGEKAWQLARAAASSPRSTALSVLGALAIVAVGVVMGTVDRLPLSSWWTGGSLIAGGLFALGTIVAGFVVARRDEPSP